MGKPKRTTYDREELEQLVTNDILNGMSRYRVLLKLERDQYPDAETSKLSRSTRYNIVQAAYEHCKVPLAEDRQKMRELCLARLEDILEEARDQNDRTNAIATIKETAKLLGLYEPDNVNVKADLNVDISFGLEEEEENNDDDLVF